MTEKDVAALSSLVTKHEATLLTWVRNQVDAGSFRTGQIKEDELTGQSQRFLRKFVKVVDGDYGGRTMAELTDDEKDAVSHRAGAVAELLAWLPPAPASE